MQSRGSRGGRGGRGAATAGRSPQPPQIQVPLNASAVAPVSIAPQPPPSGTVAPGTGVPPAAPGGALPSGNSLSGQYIKESLLFMDQNMHSAAKIVQGIPKAVDEEVKRKRRERITLTFQLMVSFSWQTLSRQPESTELRKHLLGFDADVMPLKLPLPGGPSNSISVVPDTSHAAGSSEADAAMVAGGSYNVQQVAAAQRYKLSQNVRRLREKIEAECSAAKGRNPLLVLHLYDEFGLPLVVCQLDIPLIQFPSLIVRVPRTYLNGENPIVIFERPPMGWYGAEKQARAKFYEMVSSSRKSLAVSEVLDIWAKEADAAASTLLCSFPI